MKKIVNFLKGLLPKPEPVIRFKCHIGGYYTVMPVEPARKVFPAWLKDQVDRKDVKFVKCPGMFDIAHAGYIIRAWTDIHIKASAYGVVARTPDCPDPARLAPVTMDKLVVEGLVPYRGDVAHEVMKCSSPWTVFTKKGYSAYVFPATMHSPFLDKLYVYSGVVDYDDFHTINFIFSALEECEFVIPAGTPLLQVIPFKREDMHATYGKATEREQDRNRHVMVSRIANFYRKTLHKRKTYTIEENSQ